MADPPEEGNEVSASMKLSNILPSRKCVRF
jgi:hypothetical protein